MSRLVTLRRIVIAALAAASVLAASPAATRADSNAFQADPGAGGFVDTASVAPPLRTAWSKSVAGYGYFSTPVIADGRVFVEARELGTGSTTIWAYDASGGRLLWSRTGGDYMQDSSLAYDDGKVFVVEGGGLVRALPAGSGSTVWVARHVQRDISSPPTVGGGRVYVSGNGYGSDIEAFDERTGAPVWTSHGVGGPIRFADGRLVVPDVFFCDGFDTLDAATGAVRWSGPGCAGQSGNTAMHDGATYVMRDDHVTAFRTSDGALQRRLDLARAGSGGPWPTGAFKAGTGIFAYDRTVRALDLQSGATLWSATTDSDVSGWPLIVGNAVYVATTGGDLLAYDVETGARTFTHSMGAAPQSATTMAAGSGVLALASGNGFSVLASGTPASGADRQPSTGDVPDPGDPEAGSTSDQGNAAHDGYRPGTFLDGGLRVRWSRPQSSAATPVIADGRAFTSEFDEAMGADVIRGISLNDGAGLWRRRLGSDALGPQVQFSYAQGRLLVGRGASTVSALDPASGATTWTYRPDGEGFSSPARVTAKGSTAYATFPRFDHQSRVVALDVLTGAVKWARDVDRGLGDAAVVPTAVVFGSSCGPYAFDPDTGDPLWDPPGTCVGGSSAAVVRGRRIYQGRGIYDLADGKLIDSIAGPPALAGSRALVGNFALQAEDSRDGHLLWQAMSPDGSAFGSPTIVGDTAVAATRSGGLTAFDVATGSVEWSGSAGAAVPNGPSLATAAGTLLVSASGRLVALDNAADAGPAIERVGATSDSTPDVRFADGGGAPECRVDQDAWRSCSSPWTTPELDDGEHSVAVRSTGAGAGPGSSERFTVDTAPPATVIASGPAAHSNDPGPRFEFDVAGTDEGIARFECRLGSQQWSPCKSGHRESFDTTSDQAFGAKHLEVRATDEAGNTDPTPAVYDWVYDLRSPEVRFTSTPPARTSSRSARVEFSLDEEGTTACRVDGKGTFEDCASPLRLSDLSEGVHRVEVAGRDLAGNGASAETAWTVDLTPPKVTIFGVADQDPRSTASLGFSADENATFRCRLDGGAWSQCASSRSTGPLTDGSHSFDVEATDTAGNQTVQTRSWVVDTKPPQITLHPPQGTHGPGPFTVPFEIDEPTTTVYCTQLSGATTSNPAACTSPGQGWAYASGSYSYKVEAIDRAGNRSVATSDPWTIDADPPTTSITSPQPSSAARSATLSYASNDSTATFDCRLDYGAWSSCPGGQITYNGLDDREHVFEVRATDPYGNQDASPATVAWQTDARVPDTRLLSVPPSSTSATSASFTFDSDVPDATFECRLDAETWTPCASGVQRSGIPEGGHRFQVRATRAGIGADPDPAVAEWTVDRTPPSTVFTTWPPSSTSATSARFGFAASEPGSTFLARLDGGAWRAVEPPVVLSRLTAGRHVFDVRASDPAGNAQPTPTSWSWTVTSGAAAPPAPVQPSGGQTAAPPRATGTVSTESLVRGAVADLGSRLRRLGRRALARGRAVTVVTTLNGPGRIRARLYVVRRRGSARKLLARSDRRVRSRTRLGLRLRVGQHTRGLLRGPAASRLVLDLAYEPDGGKPVRARRTLRLP